LGRLGREILWRFALFSLLILITISATTLYAGWRQIRDIRLLQEQIATWASNSINTWHIELSNNLKAACQDPMIMSATPLEIETHLRQVLVRSPTFRNVILVDARLGNRGVELLQVKGEKVSSGGNYYSEEWFYPTLTTDRYVSSVFYRSGMPAVVFAHVIKQDEQAIGVMAAEVDVSWGYALLRQYSISERGSYIYVVDRQGRPILHEDTAFVSTHQSFLNEIEGIHAAIVGQNAPFLYRGLNRDREWVIGTRKSFPELGWFVITEQPLPWVTRALLPLGGAALGVLLLSALAAALFAFYVSRRVAQPIAQLREGAQRIGAGDLQYQMALEGRNELSDLASEFNRMTNNLQAHQEAQEAWSHELEERVAERTQELQMAFEEQENLIRTIREMSSPVIPVMEGILVTPIVGTLDSERAQRIMSDILVGIERQRARVIILDITALAFMDTAVANALLQAARAAQLLGTRAILVGIAPEVAETLVQLGIEIGDLYTAATLQEGLNLALAMIHRKVTST
jgi:anti-anti-sigma factor